MKKSGALQAPPRRAASLTAAAMVHFMYDDHQIHAKIANDNAKNTTPGWVDSFICHYLIGWIVKKKF